MDLTEKKYIVSLYREKRNNERALLIADMTKELSEKREEIRNRMNKSCEREHEQKRIANNNYEAISGSFLYRMGFRKAEHKEASEAYDRACQNVLNAENPFRKEESDTIEELTYRVDQNYNKVPQRVRDFDRETFEKILKFMNNECESLM